MKSVEAHSPVPAPRLKLTRIPAAALEEKVRAAVEEGVITGAVLHVSSPDTEPLVQAFGTNGAVSGLLTDTSFDLASLTKAVVTAPLVLDLVAKGRFTLDTPIRHWFDQMEGDHRKITVGQLLLHTSGLPPGLPFRFRDSAEASVARTELRYKPGRGFLYSDLDYLLLGRIIEIETGLPLDQAARETLFLPTGMTRTNFRPLPSRTGDSSPAAGRMSFDGAVQDPLARRMGGVAGHAGLFSNAADLAAFAEMLLDDGVAHRRRVLPAAAVRYLTDPVAVDPRAYRTYGMDALSAYSSPKGDLLPFGSFGHTGSTGCSLWVDPQSRAVVILLTVGVRERTRDDLMLLRQTLMNLVAGAME